jgi:hypothetical protein
VTSTGVLLFAPPLPLARRLHALHRRWLQAARVQQLDNNTNTSRPACRAPPACAPGRHPCRKKKKKIKVARTPAAPKIGSRHPNASLRGAVGKRRPGATFPRSCAPACRRRTPHPSNRRAAIAPCHAAFGPSCRRSLMLPVPPEASTSTTSSFPAPTCTHAGSYRQGDWTPGMPPVASQADGRPHPRPSSVRRPRIAKAASQVPRPYRLPSRVSQLLPRDGLSRDGLWSTDRPTFLFRLRPTTTDAGTLTGTLDTLTAPLASHVPSLKPTSTPYRLSCQHSIAKRFAC